MCFFLRCRSAGWENSSNDEYSVLTHSMMSQSCKCSLNIKSLKAGTADSFWIQYSIWHRIVNQAKSASRWKSECWTTDLSQMLLHSHKITAVSNKSHRWSWTIDCSASAWTVWKNSIWEWCTDKTKEWKVLESVFWLCSMCIHQHQHHHSQTDLSTLKFISSSEQRQEIWCVIAHWWHKRSLTETELKRCLCSSVKTFWTIISSDNQAWMCSDTTRLWCSLTQRSSCQSCHHIYTHHSL